MSHNAANIYAPPHAAYDQDGSENTSGMGNLYPLPPEVSGWSWGAFCLSWIWAIRHRAWIGLLAAVPFLGFIIAVILGMKGREWAWQNKRWDSVEHFNSVQRRWSIWGLCLKSIFLVGILGAIVIPSYSDYRARDVTIRAYMYAQRASSHVGAYMVRQRRLPATLEGAGVPDVPPAGVRSVVLNPQTGQLEITMDKAPVAGLTFYLAPSTDEDGYIVWRCLHGELPEHLLPGECRYSAADPFRLPGR